MTDLSTRLTCAPFLSKTTASSLSSSQRTRQAGSRSTAQATPSEAAIALERPPDIVIVDLMLPEADGLTPSTTSAGAGAPAVSS
jgi:CheY-like chemotaxis protein